MASFQEIADMFDSTKWGMQFDRKDVETIARYLAFQTYEPGEHIFREGDREDYMAFIIGGHVDIQKESADRTERVLVTLSPRTHFGEMAFVDNEPRSASAQARDKVTLLLLSREHFEHIVSNEPTLGVRMLQSIAKLISQRLRATTGRLAYLRA